MLPLLALVVLVCSGLVVAPASIAAADDPGFIEPGAEPVPDRYIVTLRTPGDDVAPVAADLAAEHDGTVVATYTTAVSGFAVEMSREEALELSTSSLVASVSEDSYVHAATTQSPAPSWGLDRIDQQTLPLDNAYHYAADGTGVTAYVIDSGIRTTHADFENRATIGSDLVLDGSTDCSGHGTHVAGIIGGAKYGIAKRVSLVGVRVLDCAGQGLLSKVIQAVDWVTQNHASPAVANMSLTTATKSSVLEAAVKTSIASGVTFTVASGNKTASGSGNACDSSPAAVPEALTVGATNIVDQPASFSNAGPCVDLHAPGVSIVSDWYTGDTAINTSSGTSMAAPHVAGTAALYLGTHPTATPAEVAAAITANATPNRISGLTAGTPNLLGYTGFVVQERVTRLWGNDAIATAIATSRAGYPSDRSANAVVLARSDFFSDALAGGPLAAARGGPLLITPGAPQSSSLDSRVRDEIQRVLTVGGTVVILGGPLAVSPAIDAALGALGYPVSRVQGPNQYATAVEIANQLGNPGTVFEATGLHFADALSAVPAAIKVHGAILLTNGATQAPETAAYLALHSSTARFAIGGPLAAAGADPGALAVYGPDLFATSEAVARGFFPSASVFGVATGLDFPDALAGGVFMASGARLGPMLLVTTNVPVPFGIDSYLHDEAQGASGYVFGGPLAIADPVVAAVTAASAP